MGSELDGTGYWGLIMGLLDDGLAQVKKWITNLFVDSSFAIQ